MRVCVFSGVTVLCYQRHVLQLSLFRYLFFDDRSLDLEVFADLFASFVLKSWSILYLRIYSSKLIVRPLEKIGMDILWKKVSEIEDILRTNDLWAWVMRYKAFVDFSYCFNLSGGPNKSTFNVEQHKGTELLPLNRDQENAQKTARELIALCLESWLVLEKDRVLILPFWIRRLSALGSEE